MDPVEHLQAKFRRKRVAAAIRKLPSQQMRLCVTLCYYEELTYDEIAYVVDRSRERVRQIIEKARRILRHNTNSTKLKADAYCEIPLPARTRR